MFKNINYQKGALSENLTFILIGLAIFVTVLFASIKYLDKGAKTAWQSQTLSEPRISVETDSQIRKVANVGFDESESKLDTLEQDDSLKPLKLIKNETLVRSNAKTKSSDSTASFKNDASSLVKGSELDSKAYSFNNSNPEKMMDFSASGNAVNFQQKKAATTSRLTLVGGDNQRYDVNLNESGGFKNFSGLKDGYYRWEARSSQASSNSDATPQTQGGSGSTSNESTVERGRFQIRNGQIVSNEIPEEDLDRLERDRG